MAAGGRDRACARLDRDRGDPSQAGDEAEALSVAGDKHMKTLYQGFGATRIIEDRNLVDYVENWSKVRSPSRARPAEARLPAEHPDARGAQERSLFAGRRPDLVMHPEIARKLEQLMARQMDTLTADIIMGRPR
jgi:hypothetical protein